MTNLTAEQKTLTSLEVAEMVGREHKNVMKDIRRFSEHLGQHKSTPSYFTASTYANAQNKQQPCYLLTKKGCELYGTRMTGAKGTQFAAQYIERFNEMEAGQRPLTQVKEDIVDIKEKQVVIQDIHLLTAGNWRATANKILARIATKVGGSQEDYKDIRYNYYLD